MKRDFESEYLLAVAKRTRASTERYLVAKLKAGSGERRSSVDVERSSDVVLVDSDEEDEVDRDQEVRVEVRVKADGGRGRGRGGGREAWFDDIPDVELLNSPISAGVDEADGSGIVFLGEEEYEEEEMIRKGKAKMVADNGFVDIAGVGDVWKGGSESVRDNDECNGRGNSVCLGQKDVEDYSMASRMELGSTSKPVVDVEDAFSFSISGLGAVNENAREGDRNEVVFSSEAELETDVSSTYSEDDDSDEDFNVDMADVSCSSESVSGTDDEFSEEFPVDDVRQEESCGVECNEKASPCCSEDVIGLDEMTHVKEIFDKKIASNGNDSFVKSASCVKELVEKETEVMGKVGLSPSYSLGLRKISGNLESSRTSKISEKLSASKVSSGVGFSRSIEDNIDEEAFAVRSAPHIISTTRSRVNPDNICDNKASKTMTDHVGDRTRMRKDDQLNDSVCPGDVVNKEEHREVLEGKRAIPTSTRRTRTLEKVNVFDAFFNSLTGTGKSAVIPEDMISTNATQQKELAESVAPKSNTMLKFTFGVKMPAQREKTEFEQELDDLWDELEFGLRASEIGSLAHETVKSNKNISSKNNNIYPVFCVQGEHTFILDDEIGVKCRFCSFVQLEMKYVMPDWTKSSSRNFDRRESSNDDDPEFFDGMQFHDPKVGEPRNCSDGTVWDIIPGVKDKLYPHQRDGFEFIWLNLMGTISLDELRNSTNNGMGGCIISHAPGTGKTRLTLEFLHSYLELFPDSYPLIIAPAGMLLTWEAEFKKWGVGTPFHNLNSAFLSGKEDTAASNIFTATKQSSSTHCLRLLKLLSWKKKKSILGLSYHLFEKLAGQRFDEEKKSKTSNKKTMNEQAKEFGKIILENTGLLILDEGHTPRNPRSRIYKALTNIKTKKRIILSGTPFQNNLAELYTILSFVRPDFAQMISPELKKFCQRKVRMVNVCSGRSGSEPDVDKDDREAISQLRCKIDPFVHVHKGSVLEESLPGLKDCVMVLNPPQYQKRIVEAMETSSYTNFEFEHKLSLATIHPSLLQTEKDESFIDKAELEARRLDPNEGVKTKFLFEMIRLGEANNEKVLVFSQYLDPLGLIKDQICSLLHWREGKEVLQLVGKIELEQRQSIINVFNDPRSSAKVLLASTKACSEGISLVGASRVVLLDVVWNPSVERQAISRAFRLGQKKVVYSYNLIVGRMEWEKYGAQTNKEHVSNLVFCSNDEQEKRGRVLSEDKILDELICHNSMEGMFDKIVYYPKDSLFG